MVFLPRVTAMVTCFLPLLLAQNDTIEEGSGTLLDDILAQPTAIATGKKDLIKTISKRAADYVSLQI